MQVFGGSAIKSIQRVTISNGSTQQNITISAVDLNKAFVTATSSCNVNDISEIPRIWLTSSTQIRSERGSTGGTATTHAEIIEYV